ncbi:DUF3179 domain-containing protein [uncultured Litoreibacter sp.]|uniref:DUF3179 domain-containing protein n=1 Tax=uncultured Litoreibacter sp. TaxID=1392394 RepID=UPI00261A76E8|nr:DUF3179 domain-containing protein [uncultured Litoreibacter sp.]
MARFLCILACALMLPAFALGKSLKSGWPDTDFSKTTVDLNSIRSGGPGKDGIPAIDDPQFIKVADETRLADREPVIALEIGGPPRAYPIRYFMVHEIVNDVVNGTPVAVTFCPLCNSAMVFDARVGGKPHTFGVSGNLRNSDMVMYDRQTESWWQQAVGEGIVGQHAGAELKQLPSWMESWADFKARNPDGIVLNAPRRNFNYGYNPYVNYDSSARPFLYSGELPPNGIDPMERVVRVGDSAWPMTRIAAQRSITEAGVTLTHEGQQASALDTGNIAKGKPVSTIRVRDAQGRDVPHDVMFAFAFQAFFPDGNWRTN